MRPQATAEPGITPVKPAYIISAYRRPDLLLRLAAVLGKAPIAIYIDRKSDIFARVEAKCAQAPNITLLRRHVCHWGLFGHVRASLEGMAWFLEKTKADYAILLTGQCYPVKTQVQIERDLIDLKGRSILETTAFPKPEWAGWNEGGLRRIDRFYFHLGASQMPRAIKLWRRRLPDGLSPHGGSGYWCLSRAAVEYILSYIRAHPEVLRFFSTTLIPDETFFQTILANSPLKDSIISALIHYTDWSAGGGSPAILNEEMLPSAITSGAWFARKFEDLKILNLVDHMRGRPAAPVPPSPWRIAVGELPA